MAGASDFGSHNLAFVEAMYAQFLEDPTSVDEEWRAYFGRMPPDGNGAASPGAAAAPAPPKIETPPPAASVAAPTSTPAPVSVSAPAPSAPDALTKRLPFLKGLALFRDLPPEELIEIARITREDVREDGEVFVREGEAGQDVFVVMEGSALIRRGGRAVTELGVGEVVGELSALDGMPRSADAIARGRTRLLRIAGAELVALVGTRPSLAQGVIRVLTRRLRESTTRQDRVDQLIRAYRVRGHLIAELDPLGLPSEIFPELNPAYYGFGQADLDAPFSATTIPGRTVMTLREMISHLRKTYCRSIGVQYMHIDDIKPKMWLQERMESTQNHRQLTHDQQLHILTKLTDAEIFEQFIHKKFIGAKRFSLEGAESMIPLLDMAIEAAGDHGVEEVVIGMAHRGRLNVLANIMGKSPRQIFREFDDVRPDRYFGRGDVKYHMGYSTDRVTTSGHRVHLSLAFNPSHLEFVSPVVIGRVRAKQDRFGDAQRSRGLGILIHGDAAFAGQGVVQETLNMSELEGYKTGGTLHLIVNNQIGFTTDPRDGRSSQYATDVAKMLQIPIFHVNGEHPEAVAQAIHLAMEFREEFHKDVVIDMYCYRRHGHNEGDEPAFTQPLLYKTIRKRKSTREGYLDNLYAIGEITKDQADRIEVERRERLERELSEARSDKYETVDLSSGQGWWRTFKGGAERDVPDHDTGLRPDEAARLLESLARVPLSFTPHPKIEKILETRRAMGRGEQPLDWGAAESLAFASLLVEGARIRLAGQDVERGTFSHRHAMLHDVDNGRRHCPLRHLSPDQGIFEVYNSPLSEIGVLGFEYGYSLDYPDALCIWEAQFGDFANVAQVIIDQFISSGEDKWARLSGLVLLLPHGFEGQGPEHSSARLERFLVLAAEDNIQVANCTTPAQLFHLLRRQVVRPLRKPLVLMTPKSLLRHPKVVSPLEDFTHGRFSRFLAEADPRVEPARVRKVLLTSGKVYWELEKAREERGAWDVAIVRIEQYYPLHVDSLHELLSVYPGAAPRVWVQEEPSNMGAWAFLRLRLGDRMRLSLVSRPESASPATGSGGAHKMEQAQIMDDAFSA